MEFIMANFRLGIVIVQARWAAGFCLFIVWAGCFLVPSGGEGQTNPVGSYVVKQYPDGTLTKVKWENIGRVKDLSGERGGGAIFRPASKGELEKLREEFPEGIQPSTASDPGLRPPAGPEKITPPAGRKPPPAAPEIRTYEAACPSYPESRQARIMPGEASALPSRTGPSVQYGQAYQDYGTMPLRIDPPPRELRPAEEPPPPPEAQQPFLSELQGIVLCEDASQIVPRGIDGPPGIKSRVSYLSEEEAKRLLRSYLRKPASMATLGEIRKALLQFMASSGQEVVSILVPEQEIKNGILQMLVLRGRVGVVRVEGNRYFSAENIRQQIRLHPGEAIDLRELGEDAGWLNSNPFRQVEMSLAPGNEQGMTDVVLEVKDRFPVRPFISYDNFGVQSLGYDRYSAGLTLMDIWTGLDQKFDYQYLTSGNFSKLKANSGAWTIALPWRDTASIFGSYSLANPDASGQLDFNSYYWQTSFRYNFVLPDLDLGESGFGWRHQAYLGFDFKAANSDVFFAGTAIPPSVNGLAGLYNIAQFPFGYTATIIDPVGSTGVECAGFWSPGGLTSNNSDSSFQQINGGAMANYLYGKFLLNRVFLLPEKISLVGNFQVQQSNRTLMPTESFGIGGYDTVRGYDQRSANGDNAYLLNLECRSPGISFGQEFGSGEFPDQLVLLGFFDYGRVLQVSSDTTTSVNWTLASLGPGLRYSIGPWFQVRFDWGFQLKQAPPGTTGGTGGRAGTSQAVLSVSLAY
jgi:hemolysin activation/secretion protein